MLVMIAVIYIIIVLVYDHVCGVSADHNSKTYIKDIPTPTKPTNTQTVKVITEHYTRAT